MRILTLAFALVTLIAFNTAHAEDAPAQAKSAAPLPLNIGNWEVGGSGSFTRNVRTNQRYLSLTPKAEYFFVNRFSAGGTLIYTDDNTLGSTYGIGPSATYYITHTETLAVSIDQAILWSRPYVGDNYVMGATGVALDYFFTPSIAFGPELKAYYYFNGGLNKPDDAVQVAFNFSLFL
jgi:hypothetical protein